MSLIFVLVSVPVDEPVTHEQRGALFASFGEVFGQTGSEQRYAFTRLALGLPADEVVSWSAHKEGALSKTEASRVLDTLNLLNV